MARFHCSNSSCRYGFTSEDVTLEDSMLGYVTCPACDCTTETLDNPVSTGELTPTDRAVLDLTEQVATLQAQLTELTITMNKLRDCAHTHKEIHSTMRGTS